jgi:tetratricopeptide (TPR) repeat protein
LEKLGDYEGAKQGYLRALEINRKAFGEDHTEYATTLENLSIVLEKLGDYEGAKQGYLRALEIKESIRRRPHRICNDSTEFIKCLENLGDYEGAKQGYLRALEIKRKHSEKTTQNMQRLYRIYQMS